MKALHSIAFVLLVIGGLNWLLVGLGVGDVVAYLGSALATIVYILVGLSALYLVFTHKSSCKNCETSSPAPMM
ncbi:MAG: DUF378 domain-containing protein [Candidatus Paceibacterota bacterium]